MCMKLILEMLSKQFVVLLFVILDGSKLMRSSEGLKSSVTFVTVLFFSFVFVISIPHFLLGNSPKF